jgi:hypothetical protein
MGLGCVPAAAGNLEWSTFRFCQGAQPWLDDNSKLTEFNPEALPLKA